MNRRERGQIPACIRGRLRQLICTVLRLCRGVDAKVYHTRTSGICTLQTHPGFCPNASFPEEGRKNRVQQARIPSTGKSPNAGTCRSCYALIPCIALRAFACHAPCSV